VILHLACKLVITYPTKTSVQKSPNAEK